MDSSRLFKDIFRALSCRISKQLGRSNQVVLNFSTYTAPFETFLSRRRRCMKGTWSKLVRTGQRLEYTGWECIPTLAGGHSNCWPTVVFSLALKRLAGRNNSPTLYVCGSRRFCLWCFSARWKEYLSSQHMALCGKTTVHQPGDEGLIWLWTAVMCLRQC